MTETSAKPARRTRVWLRRGVIALGVSLVLSEVLLRLIFGLGSPVLYQADVDCRYLPKPDQHLYRFFSHNDINHYSMRSAAFEMPRPKGVRRFLFIGDSVTYGTSYVDQPLIFTSRLNTMLSAIEHKPVEVLNASAGGWGVGNEVGYLRSRGTFDANAVLIVLNTGDPGQPTAEFPHNLNFPEQRPWTAIGEAWWRYVVPRLFSEPIPNDPGTAEVQLEQEIKTSAANMQLLEEANNYCQKAGTLFAVVYVPFAGVTGPLKERAHNTLVEWTRTHNVPFIDIFEVFEKERAGELTVDGMHLRPYGDEVAAREIAKQWGTIDAGLASSPATSTSP